MRTQGAPVRVRIFDNSDGFSLHNATQLCQVFTPFRLLQVAYARLLVQVPFSIIREYSKRLKIMALFQRAVLNKYLSGIDEKALEAAWETFSGHFHNSEIQKNIRNQQKARADELKSQISQTDFEIDAMVYELYGLGEEEVKVVEGIK